MLLYPIFVNKICLSYHYFNFSFTSTESPIFTITNDGVYIANRNHNIYCEGISDFHEFQQLSEKIVSKAIFQVNDTENDFNYTICTISGIGIDRNEWIPNIFCFGYLLNQNEKRKYQ